MARGRQFTVREVLLLVTLICTWLAITVQLKTFGVPFWGFAVVMAAVLRPGHQRHETPNSVTDVLSVSISWSVMGGVVGLALDVWLAGRASFSLFCWAVLCQLTGFYLGMVWVLVVLLARHVERVARPLSRRRSVA